MSEGLMEGEASSPAAEPETIEASREFTAGRWHQYLRLSKYRGSVYLDEGNGALTSPADPE